MDKFEFEPTPTATRHEYIRKVLTDRYTQVLKDGLAPMPINNDKDLQGFKPTLDSVKYERNRQNFPLNGAESKDVSFWSPYAHPTRGFKRTNEFTKPDREYLGTSQWR